VRETLTKHQYTAPKDLYTGVRDSVAKRKRVGLHTAIALVIVMAGASQGCARLPYTTQIVQQDQRVMVVVQHEVRRVAYTHPAKLTPDELTTILNGFSLRETKAVPLRWFAEEVPPQKLFRQDELDVLARPLASALESAGPEERVYFHVYMPGPNPNYDRDTTAGWLAFRDPYLHLEIDYFHTLLPVRKIDQYDYNFPLIPASPGSYLLYYEPGRFWVNDPSSGTRAIDVRALLKSGFVSEGR
jgi:hypothetical protein